MTIYIRRYKCFQHVFFFFLCKIEVMENKLLYWKVRRKPTIE